MIASRLAPWVAKSALGRAVCRLKRGATTLATASAIALACIAVPAQAAKLTRMEIGGRTRRPICSAASSSAASFWRCRPRVTASSPTAGWP